VSSSLPWLENFHQYEGFSLSAGKKSSYYRLEWGKRSLMENIIEPNAKKNIKLKPCGFLYHPKPSFFGHHRFLTFFNHPPELSAGKNHGKTIHPRNLQGFPQGFQHGVGQFHRSLAGGFEWEIHGEISYKWRFLGGKISHFNR
jgi:hypothetical protein